jgi:hypothetical protein
MRMLKPGAFEIADEDWQDDHHAWEIDFHTMTAIFWDEGRDDDWSGTEYQIRRVKDGWEFYQDDQQWQLEVDAMRSNLVRRKSERTEQFPPSFQADLVEQCMALERRLKEVEARGPRWIAFPSSMAQEIETEWQKRSAPGVNP